MKFKTKSKSIFGPCQKFKFWMLSLVGTCYELVTGKTEYKLSFELFNRRFDIEKYSEPAEEQK